MDVMRVEVLGATWVVAWVASWVVTPVVALVAVLVAVRAVAQVVARVAAQVAAQVVALATARVVMRGGDAPDNAPVSTHVDAKKTADDRALSLQPSARGAPCARATSTADSRTHAANSAAMMPMVTSYACA